MSRRAPRHALQRITINPRTRPCIAVALLAATLLAPASSLASPPDTAADWRQRLLTAAEDAERRISELLEGFGADPGTGSMHGMRGLTVVDADGSPVNGWPPSPAPARVVVLIHGLDEPGSIWNELIPTLNEHGYTVARFDYANDQPASDSAADFAKALATLHDAGVQRIDIIAHSLGGLVTLDLLTSPDLAAARGSMPRIERVVTLGAPFGGSPFARLRAISEIRDHVERWIDSGSRDLSTLVDWTSDGDGQAGLDLLPGSTYLRELASRTPPPDVAFTAVIARMADVRAADITGLTDSWLFRRVAGDEEAEAIADSLRRASLEVGDGVVSESSARAIPFTDTVVVDANHREMIETIEPLDAARRAVGLQDGVRTPPAIPIVLERLGRDTAPSTGPSAGSKPSAGG